MAEMKMRVKPIIIKDTETGEAKYTLEFNRKTVAMAERQGFKLDNLAAFPLTSCQSLFHYAFQMNHGGIDRRKTDELFDELGGIEAKGLVERLIELYNSAMRSTKIDDNGEVKNAKYALDL